MKLCSTVLLALLLAAAVFVHECDGQDERRQRRRGGNRNRNRANRRRGGRRRPIRPIPQPPRDCGPIPHIDNSQALHTAADEVLYACEPGYKLEGTNVITCLNGRWTVAPRCVRQICPAPMRGAFASPPVLTQSGTVATYNCLPGNRIVNGNGVTSQTIACTRATMQWPAIPQCEPIPSVQCGAPPSVLHASSQVSGNTATYTCDAGYTRRANTPTQITCVNAQWTWTTAPACDADPTVTQPAPKCTKAPPCGGSTIMRGEVADSYDVGNTVKYTCINGYRLVGSNDNSKKEVDVACKSDGQWDAVPTCEPVVCGQPAHVLGGNTNPTTASAVTFGSQYTYTCINLYETTAATVATCNAAGEWSIPAPTCSLKFCLFTALPTLANGQAYMVTANANIPVNTAVTFQCNSGYRIAPDSVTSSAVLQSITCQESGTFSAFTHSCVYNRPTSCLDYWNRDNALSGVATSFSVSVVIDTDGAGTDPEQTVTCVRTSSTQVCTQVAPVTSTNSLTGAQACGQGGTTLLPNIVFVPTAAQAAGVCDEKTVTYGSTTPQLTALFSSSTNCQQRVTIACPAVTADDEDANFLALRLNGQSATARGLTGSGIASAATPTDVTPGAANLLGRAAPCDCGSASPTPCITGCHCSLTGSTGTSTADTITIPLTGTNPQYVTGIARVGGTDAQPPSLDSGEFDVTVESISCCVSTA